jgi:outer membrane receptor protein involved in Fe transport
MAATAHWCGLFERDSTTGQIEHSVDTLVNYSDREVEGIDTQLEWHAAAGPGQLSLSALASWLDQFTVEPYHGLPRDERTGLVGGGVGGSQPEWKFNLRLRYDWRALGTGVTWRYIDAMQAADPQGFGWDYRVPSYDYFDLFAEYRFEDGMLDALVLRGGIENLTDEQPPLVPAWTAANTDPSQYDVFGRRFYLNASYRF